MIRIQTIKSFLGFGDGIRKGEYYYSQGIGRSREGIKPSWGISKIIDSGTLGGLAVIKWFTQRKEADGKIYNFGVDKNGVIYKCEQLIGTWAAINSPVSSFGNGLGVDKKDNIIYAQHQYLGKGTTANPNVWTDNWKDLGADEGTMPRPIENYEDWTLIGNKNKIAGYTGDGTDFGPNLFNLPEGFVINNIKAGKTGVLIGANKDNIGILVLWDCYSNRSITPWIYLEGNIYSIASYNGQWIVAAGSKFFITNGYTIETLCVPPDSRTSDTEFITTVTQVGMVVKDHYLFVNGKINGLNRKQTGLWIYDFRTKLWEFCPISNNCVMYVNLGALFVDNAFSFFTSYSSDYPAKRYIGMIYNGAPQKSFYISSVLGATDTKKIAEGLILNLAFDLYNHSVYDSLNIKITAKIYDFKRQLWGVGVTSAVSTAKDELKVDGAASGYNYAEIGDEITILQGVNAGEIKHIKEIQNPGQTPEIWVLDSELPLLTEQSTYLGVCPFKKIGEQLITAPKIKDYYFNIKHSPIGKKFLIKICLDMGRTYDMMIPELSSLSFIFNDLGIL